MDGGSSSSTGELNNSGPPSRKSAVAEQLSLASRNTEFRRHISHADTCREAGSWGAAEHSYWRALELFPLHSGYTVQYGHMLKEQEKFVEAEIQYRTALALGETSPDLLMHLSFAAERSGNPIDQAVIDAVIGYWKSTTVQASSLSAPPTRQDVDILFQLALGRSPFTFQDCRDVLNSAPTITDVFVAALSEPDFPRNNRKLLAFLAERSVAK